MRAAFGLGDPGYKGLTVQRTLAADIHRTVSPLYPASWRSPAQSRTRAG